MEESEEYKKAVASYDLTIEKADQTGFVFANPNPGKQGWGTESFENAASGGEGTGAIHYAVTEGNECGSVDPDSGVLTFIKEGTIKVTAGERRGFLLQSGSGILPDYGGEGRSDRFSV